MYLYKIKKNRQYPPYCYLDKRLKGYTLLNMAGYI